MAIAGKTGVRTTSQGIILAGVVCLLVKLCDPYLSALEVRFSRRGAIQIYVYLYLQLFGGVEQRAEGFFV